MRIMVLFIFIFLTICFAYAQNSCVNGCFPYEANKQKANEILEQRKNEIDKFKSNLKINLDDVKNKDKGVAEESYKEYRNNRKQASNVKIYSENIWANIKRELSSGKWGVMDVNSVDDMMEFIRLNSYWQYDNKYLFFFISSSIPKNKLKEYVKFFDGKNKYVVFVLNGVIGNDIKKIMPTIKWVQDLLCDGDKCADIIVDINPILFQKMNINRVPALVYVPDPSVLTKEKLEDDEYFIFFGGVSPGYVLSKMQMVRPNDLKLVELQKSLSVGAE